MIKVENLKKEFDGFVALDGVNLNAKKGSVYGLVGPNGAGKSTLIRHLTGIYKQDSGTVTIDGQNVYENDEIKARIGYIPDDIFFFMQANIKDMMKFYRGIYKNFNMERYNKLLNVFELVNNKRPIRKMSKGMQKQAAFMLTICTMADVIILDEPVDGLDPVMRKQVWSLLLQDVAERGTTVLISSHNLRELEDVCDTVGIMNRGKLLIEKPLSSIQGSTTKVQVAFGKGEPPKELAEKIEHHDSKVTLNGIEILHVSKSGSVYTAIMHSDAEKAEEVMSVYNPILCDAIPLTLEEVFIYELGGENYAVKEILL